MNIFYKFGDLWCQFQNFDLECFWNLWQWKLDPYQKLVSSQISHGLNISGGVCKQTSSFNDKKELLLSETSGFFDRRVYRCTNGGTIWSLIRRANEKVYLQYAVSPAWDEIILLTDCTNTAGNLAFEYLGQIIPCVLLKHQILTFHGVLMEYHGKGIIISAPSGTGKTTHARMWRDSRNALIINGDRATCQKVDGIWAGFGLPWSGSSGEQINRSVLITAIVMLERGDMNQAQQLTNPLEAFVSLLPHVQYPSWDKKLASQAMDLLEDFLQEIPVIRLHCLPDFEAVDVLENAIKQL